MKFETIKFRLKHGVTQLRHDLNEAASFILKVAIGVALGILMAAPLLGM